MENLCPGGEVAYTSLQCNVEGHLRINTICGFRVPGRELALLLDLGRVETEAGDEIKGQTQRLFEAETGAARREDLDQPQPAELSRRTE